MDQEKSFLGRGWSFPPTFRKEMADIEMVSKEEDIRQSLQIFFNTKIGERIMRSNYGCIVHEYMFQKAESNVLDKQFLFVGDSRPRRRQNNHSTRVE